MKTSEFDQFADEYKKLLNQSISISGETSEYFHEYKIRDISQIIKKNCLTSEKIMDLGCGVGNSIPYYKKYFPDSEIFAVDVSEKSIEIAKNRFPNQANYSLFDGKKLPFQENSFDLIQMNCVLHHIDPAEHINLFKEIFNTLKPNGIFFAYEHNPYNPVTRKVVKDCPFDENAILLRPQDLSHKLSQVGFKNVTIEFKVFFPQLLSKFRFLENYIKFLPLGAQYSVVAFKKV